MDSRQSGGRSGGRTISHIQDSSVAALDNWKGIVNRFMNFAVLSRLESSSRDFYQRMEIRAFYGTRAAGIFVKGIPCF